MSNPNYQTVMHHTLFFGDLKISYVLSMLEALLLEMANEALGMLLPYIGGAWMATARAASITCAVRTTQTSTNWPLNDRWALKWPLNDRRANTRYGRSVDGHRSVHNGTNHLMCPFPIEPTNADMDMLTWASQILPTPASAIAAVHCRRVRCTGLSQSNTPHFGGD